MATSAIDRAQLVTLLSRWERGLIGEFQVQEMAEAMLAKCRPIEEVVHDDDESIVVEVLQYLDALPALLITRDDIGAIRDFLHTPDGRAGDGWRTWNAY